ncbi:MAG: hypothetical protein IPK08_06185 [Bacteroidetes bacterium]|nr:hypothetical protein [Bacteroidota bacterium]
MEEFLAIFSPAVRKYIKENKSDKSAMNALTFTYPMITSLIAVQEIPVNKMNNYYRLLGILGLVCLFFTFYNIENTKCIF